MAATDDRYIPPSERRALDIQAATDQANRSHQVVLNLLINFDKGWNGSELAPIDGTSQSSGLSYEQGG